jgi:hypothetical protein
MKVFRVVPDVRNFQTLTPDDMDWWADFALSIDCFPKKDVWKPSMFYVRQPKLRVGNFWDITPGFLVADDKAAAHVEEFFEMAGEVLPLPFEGRVFSLLNVTQCLNCLNHEASQWREPAARTGRPLKYVFHPRRMDEAGLFKIPETQRAEVLFLEREGDPETEFKAAVESHGFTGLIFEELWSDQDS